MRLIRYENRLVNGVSIEKVTAHKPIESRQQMRIRRRPALWKHDREVECILLQRERDALPVHGFLTACC
jgi:hypothetical protein